MLGVALDITHSGLTVSSDRAAVVSRNIANADNSLASRKYANTVTRLGGGAVVATVTRATNDALARNLQATIALNAGQSVISDSLDQLEATVNDPELGLSPAAMLQKLKTSLTTLSSSPNDTMALTGTIDSANRLATSLNDATAAIQTVRQQADADMAASVELVNALLSKFEDLNNEIMIGSRAGEDVTDQMDARDEILRSVAEQISIKTISRADDDIAIFTDSGMTLFDLRPREVSMQRSYSLVPGISGNSVYIDGVAATGSGNLMGVQAGKLAGYAKVRDEIAVTYQRQMDEIARGLITAFSESDQSASPTLPDITGLFSYSGSPAMPSSLSVHDGLAGEIRVNSSVDPAQGGNVRLIRDGAIGDPGNPTYVYNTTGASGFTDRIYQLIDKLSVTQSFHNSSELSPSASVFDFASSSSGWLEDQRQKASNDVEYSSTLVNRSRDALSRSIGVNLDEEMTMLLDVERSYQTSSKMLGTLDNMFQALLNAL